MRMLHTRRAHEGGAGGGLSPSTLRWCNGHGTAATWNRRFFVLDCQRVWHAPMVLVCSRAATGALQDSPPPPPTHPFSPMPSPPPQPTLPPPTHTLSRTAAFAGWEGGDGGMAWPVARVVELRQQPVLLCCGVVAHDRGILVCGWMLIGVPGFVRGLGGTSGGVGVGGGASWTS